MKITLTEDVNYDEMGEIPRTRKQHIRGTDENGQYIDTYIEDPEKWAENDGKKVGDVVEIGENE